MSNQSRVGISGRDDLRALGQLQIVNLSKPFIQKAIEAHSANLTPSSSSSSKCDIVVADFGANSGAGTSAAMAMVVGELRAKYGLEAVSVITAVHNDLPRKNWSRLFNFLHSSPQSYLKKHTGVVSLVSAQTFYRQVLPDCSLHVGVSNGAIQRLSEMPCRLTGHCYACFGLPTEQEMWKRQAAKDWATFLRYRARELVRGGVLVVNVWTYEKDSLFIFDAVYQAAVALKEKGAVTEQELLDFNLPAYCRTLEECAADASLLDSVGLQVIAAETCPPAVNVYYEAYRKHNNLDRFVDECGAPMPSVETALLNALSAARSEESRKAICIHFWREYRAVLKRSPDQCAKLSGNAFVVFRKK